MTVIDDYLHTLEDSNQMLVGHMYTLVRKSVPDATEELSYAMPAFKWRGKGLLAVMVNKDFLSLYPFCAVERLGLDLSGYECTSGSMHFTLDHPIPDKLLQQIIAARQRLIGS